MCRNAKAVMVRLMFVGPILAALILGPLPAQSQTAALELVSIKHIPGGFVGTQQVCADRDRIYLASYQGELFVLARDREGDFPVLETVRVSNTPLTSVRENGQFVYVAASDFERSPVAWNWTVWFP